MYVRRPATAKNMPQIRTSVANVFSAHLQPTWLLHAKHEGQHHRGPFLLRRDPRSSKAEPPPDERDVEPIHTFSERRAERTRKQPWVPRHFNQVLQVRHRLHICNYKLLFHAVDTQILTAVGSVSMAVRSPALTAVTRFIRVKGPSA